MSRKQPKRRAGAMVKLTIVGFFILLVACGVGFGVASAEVSDKVADTSAFGFDAATHAATSLESSAEKGSESDATSDQEEFASQITLLSASNYRSLDAGFQMIDDLEAAEAQRLQEEKEQALARVASNKRKQGVRNEVVSPSDGDADEYGLSPVDWTVGKDAFVAEWTKRIDAYLGSSNLAGYGSVFAEAAWANGVDPRWSPAVSNTESGMGSVCFLPFNAWGWGSRTWSNWVSAITDHVAGLADGYGYSLTKEAASRYCPPTYLHWYDVTLEQMRRI